MKTVIYYFTGTGNSLLIARKIAERLEEAIVVPIASEIKKSTRDKVPSKDVQTIGFVFPVYFLGVPDIVLRFINNCEFFEKQYIFAVATNGGQVGNAIGEIDFALGTKGVRLDYGKEVKMPDNSIMFTTTEEKASKLLGQVDEAVEDIASSVGNRIQIHFKNKKIVAGVGRLSRGLLEFFYAAKQRKANATRCNGCGLCANLCPVGNIVINKGKVEISNNCEWCFSCLNLCPKSAITFGKIDPINKQYRCPGISISDIACKQIK